MLVEDEAAEVAEAELADAAQVAQAPAQPAALAEARAVGDRLLAGGDLGRRPARWRSAARRRSVGRRLVGGSRRRGRRQVRGGLRLGRRLRRGLRGLDPVGRTLGAPAADGVQRALHAETAPDSAPRRATVAPRPTRRARVAPCAEPTTARPGRGPATRGSAACEVRLRARPATRARSNGAQSVPATPSRAAGWMPTGVASTGTSHASASSTARPKPSCVGGHEHGVGGVDPERHLEGMNAPERQESRRRPATSLRAVEALDRRARGRPGRAGSGRRGPGRGARAPRRAGSARSGRGRRRTAAPRRAGASPAPGTSRASSGLTAATRSTNGSAARVMRRERGWRRSVPWSVTTCGAPRSGERRPGGEAEVGVDDVEALARDSGGAASRAARR